MSERSACELPGDALAWLREHDPDAHRALVAEQAREAGLTVIERVDGASVDFPDANASPARTPTSRSVCAAHAGEEVPHGR